MIQRPSVLVDRKQVLKQQDKTSKPLTKKKKKKIRIL